jgi:ribonuclease D
MNMISSTADLAAACARLAAHPYVTVDTEFLRDSTYYSKLCLVQIASPEEALLVDPLAKGLDLAPFFALMTDASVVKVFHAARQDLEIIWQMGQVIPAPLFDTQIAAMVCGYGDSVGYEQLANDLAKARIDKSSRFTDWSRRPLSEAQLSYALSDVTHLRLIYAGLSEQLEKSGRTAWLAEEMAILQSPGTYETKPEDAWLRLRGRARKPKEIAILMELAAWREVEAQTKDVPRSEQALSDLRSLPRGFERSRSGAEVLEAVERALARDPKTLPRSDRDQPRNANGAVLDLLKVLLKAVCDGEKVAPKIIATVDDLEAIVADDAADVPALKGWRRALFGDKALALKNGQLSLRIRDGRVTVEA